MRIIIDRCTLGRVFSMKAAQKDGTSYPASFYATFHDETGGELPFQSREDVFSQLPKAYPLKVEAEVRTVVFGTGKESKLRLELLKFRAEPVEVPGILKKGGA